MIDDAYFAGSWLGNADDLPEAEIAARLLRRQDVDLAVRLVELECLDRLRAPRLVHGRVGEVLRRVAVGRVERLARGRRGGGGRRGGRGLLRLVLLGSSCAIPTVTAIPTAMMMSAPSGPTRRLKSDPKPCPTVAAQKSCGRAMSSRSARRL